MKPPITYWFTMIEKDDAWVRIGPAYKTEKIARNWLKFVKGRYKTRRGKISQFTLRFDKHGMLTARCERILAEKYRMNEPQQPGDLQ